MSVASAEVAKSAAEVKSVDAIARRNRRLAGLPREVDPRQTWLQRKLAGPQLWIVIGALTVYVLGLWHFYRLESSLTMQQIAEATQKAGNPTTLTISQFNEALWSVIFHFDVGAYGVKLAPGALWTLLFWIVVFCLLDRLRPTPPSAKVVALGWGICGAPLIALYVNTWVSTLVSYTVRIDPSSDPRPAVFIAPFVEEASKALIVFALAIALRHRLVTPFQVIGLAGLSAAGFAFTENITYYLPQYLSATKIIGTDPAQVMDQAMWLRGVCTCFGHPLFTAMTAVGIVMGIRVHSRLVRILCPLAGYLVAATLHMVFNGFSSLGASASVLVIGGLVLIVMGLFWLWRQLAKERATIAWRLDDYVRMGWLQSSDPLIFNRIGYRAKLGLAGLLRGRRVCKATITLIAAITELAYLRAAMVDGLVDEPGLVRERELLIDIRALRGIALDDPANLSVKPPTWHPVTRLRAAWTRLQNRRHFAPPSGVPAYPPARPVQPGYRPVQQYPGPPRSAYPAGVYTGGGAVGRPNRY
ncbi:MAG: PrsW family intramembrane metalloprotease [Propionibacteriaceae bacterium]|nr:PrsW family intramembrane metalloprotease [Propionibacteriaceae bacterium]